MKLNANVYPKLKKAFDHVRGFHPQINTVVFDAESRWYYFGNSIDDHPEFSQAVDIGILEDAQSEIGNKIGFPCLVQYS